MINISSAARQAMQSDAVQYIKIKVEPLTGDPFTITDADITQGGMKIETHTLDGEELEIGNMNAAVLDLTLDNESGKFNGVRFAGARLTVFVGIDVNETVEHMPLGVFTVDEQPHLWGTVSLAAYDNMVQMDIPYKPSTVFPNSLRNLVRECVEQSGLTCYDYSMFPDEYIITVPPSGDNLTYRQVAMWCCQCACVNGCADENGNVKFAFYRKYTPEALQAENGESLELENGDILLANGVGDVHYHLKASERFISNMMIEEEDVMITGHRFTDDEDNIYPADVNTEYCIETTGNGVFNAMTVEGKIATAAAVDEAIRGFTYRAFTAEIVSLPFLQAGDSIAYHDENGLYQTFITNWEYNPNGKMSISAKAKSLREKGYAPLGSLTPGQKAIIEQVNKNVEKTKSELSTQEKATDHLNKTAASAMGLYYTERFDENGGTIRYWHDDVSLEGSLYICMQNSNGSFSTNSGWNDGNPIWTEGTDKFGNAVCSLLNTIGIQAEWIRADSITTDKLSIGQVERGTNLIEDSSFESNSLCVRGTYDEDGTTLVTPGHNDYWNAVYFSASDEYDISYVEVLYAPSVGGFDGNKGILDVNLKGLLSDEELWFTGVEHIEPIPVEMITHIISFYYRVKNAPSEQTQTAEIVRAKYAFKIQWLDFNKNPISSTIQSFDVQSNGTLDWSRLHASVTPVNGAKYARFAIGFNCTDEPVWDNGEETGEQGFKDIAFLDLDGILFEQGTALNAWTCAQSEVENSGVIINSTGLNIADGKIYVTDPFGRKVLYIDGQQAMQLIGGLTTQIFDPVSKKAYAQSTIQPVYESYPLDESGSLTGSGHLRQVFEKADENGKMQTLASIGMTFSNDKTTNNDYPLSFFSKHGFEFNGAHPLVSEPVYVPDNTNLNNLKTPGWYYNGVSAQVHYIKNLPIQMAFLLRVERIGGMVLQTCTACDASVEYKRWYQSWEPVKWSAWRPSMQPVIPRPGDSVSINGCKDPGTLAPGTYYVETNDITSVQTETDVNIGIGTFSQYPVKKRGILECFETTNGNRFQRYTTVDGIIYTRVTENGSLNWTLWYCWGTASIA